MKLYKVVIKGGFQPVGTDYHQAYVIADNTDEAYNLYLNFLETHDVLFESERVLQSVELLAEESDYPDCGILLIRKKSEGVKI